MKVTAATLPRRSARASRPPSAVVSENAGAVPIVGSRASRPGWCASAGIAAERTNATASPRPYVAPSVSALQLLLQLVNEPPVHAVGDDLLRARLDHPRLVHAQGE